MDSVTLITGIREARAHALAVEEGFGENVAVRRYQRDPFTLADDGHAKILDLETLQEQPLTLWEHQREVIAAWVDVDYLNETRASPLPQRPRGEVPADGPDLGDGVPDHLGAQLPRPWPGWRSRRSWARCATRGRRRTASSGRSSSSGSTCPTTCKRPSSSRGQRPFDSESGTHEQLPLGRGRDPGRRARRQVRLRIPRRGEPHPLGEDRPHRRLARVPERALLQLHPERRGSSLLLAEGHAACRAIRSCAITGRGIRCTRAGCTCRGTVTRWRHEGAGSRRDAANDSECAEIAAGVRALSRDDGGCPLDRARPALAPLPRPPHLRLVRAGDPRPHRRAGRPGVGHRLRRFAPGPRIHGVLRTSGTSCPTSPTTRRCPSSLLRLRVGDELGRDLPGDARLSTG